MKIIPTIFESSLQIALQKIYLTLKFFDLIQIDVGDEKIAGVKTFSLVNVPDNTSRYDIHLMVSRPKKYFKQLKILQPYRVTTQIENIKKIDKYLDSLLEICPKVGLGFDISTPVENGEYLSRLDLVLIMGRKAGKKPAPFEMEALKKIKLLSDLRDKFKYKYKIGVDGGVDKTNIKKISRAGADMVYCGQAIFMGDLKTNLEALKKAMPKS